MTIVWYMPDGSREDRSQSGEGAKTLPHLNHAGWQGWELVAVTEDYRPERSELRIERYHFKRMVS